MKGFIISVSDEALADFIKRHKETVMKLSQGEELISWVEQAKCYDPIKEKFFDWEPLVGNCSGIYGMIADVMTLESKIPFRYWSFGSDERKEVICVSKRNLLLYPNAVKTMREYREELNKAMKIEEINGPTEFSVDAFILLMEEHTLSPEECSSLFRALMDQSNVLGGKLWTVADIVSLIPEEELDQLSDLELDALLGEVKDNIDTDALNDCTDNEWDSIHWALSTAADFDIDLDD